MRTFEEESSEACFSSAAAAFAAFLAASLAARFCASMLRLDVAASRASLERTVSEGGR
jgi:hypothetical protein